MSLECLLNRRPRSQLYKTALRVVSRWHAVSGRWIVKASAVLHIGEYLLSSRGRGDKNSRLFS
jgi:hypothetical protein